MTGHKEDSHKKRKLTRKEHNDEKPLPKKQQLSTSPATVAVTSVVTQTQDSPECPPSPFEDTVVNDVVPTSSSPVGDYKALSTMVSGEMNPHSEPGVGRDYRIQRLELFKDRTGKKKAAKLTTVSVFNFIRQGYIKSNIDDLLHARRPQANSSQSVRKAINFFDTIPYKRQTKVDPGKSRRIAELVQEKKRTETVKGVPAVTPEAIRQVDVPTFDIKRASKLIPTFDWKQFIPTFSLDSRKLRRYVVEDVMFADPSVHERLLLVVSGKHPAFTTVWLPIHRRQDASRAPIMFGKDIFFQIEAEVVKNSKRSDYISGLATEDDIQYQITYEGGGGVCLHFPSCERSFDIELKFASIFCETSTFQVWGTRPLTREFHQKLVRLKNSDNREALFCRYLQELYGDSTQTMYLSACYKIFELESRDSDKKALGSVVASSMDPVTDDRFSCLEIGGTVYKTFVHDVDVVFREAVVDCYGRFVSLTEPIVPQTTISRLVEEFIEKFPCHYWAIATILNYNVHMKKDRSQHLLPFYNRMIFYHFMSMCRVRCHRTFSWWALVNACIRYGSAVNSAVSGLDSVFFGHSLVPFSVMRKTKEFREIDDSYFNRVNESVQGDSVLLTVFDNTQIGVQSKFQREGKSNSFLKMTAKMFVKVQNKWLVEELKHDDFKVTIPITFLDQVILSPYGMPRYETMLHRPPEFVISNYDAPCYDSFRGSDSSGLRVTTYLGHVNLSIEFQAQQRFLSRPNKVTSFMNPRSLTAIVDSGLREILSKNRSSNGLYDRAHKFQAESVKKWKGNQEKAKLLCLPLSLDDETKTEECGNVLLSFLERSGIIEVRDQQATSIKLADDYASKWQITVGDGLSQMRMRQYNDRIDAASLNFRQQFRQSIVFSKAMDQVLMVPGDLHGGGFHFLATVYYLYYGCFLQAMQYSLGWKRIRGSDVTKSYQQSAALALLVLGEVERGLYGLFVEEMVTSQGKHCFQTYKEAPRTLAAYMGAEFLKWVDKKRKSTTDEVLRLCLNFMQLTRKYKQFRLAVRNGDSIMVEYLYGVFIPIWMMTSKHNYVEIALNQIEDLYGRVPFHILQATRENRMQAIHSGRDRDGRPMAQWAMDAIMELLQIKYKAMNFPNSREGWQNHSTNMPLVARAKTYCSTEYTRRYDVDSYDEMFFEFEASGDKQDKGNNKLRTKVPKQHRERIMVSEILHLVDAFTETNGRKMNKDTFWMVLKDVSTTFEKETSEANDAEANLNGRSLGEKALVEVNRELMQNSLGTGETSEEVADASEMDQMAWFDQLAEEDATMLDSDEEEEEGNGTESLTLGEATETNDTENANVVDTINEQTTTVEDAQGGTEVLNGNTRRSARIEIEDAESEVVIGVARKKVRVRKAKFNPLGIRDVVEEGNEKMRKMNIPEVRHRRRCREKREIRTLQKELDDFLSNKDGGSKITRIMEQLEDTGNDPISHNRVEYRMMTTGSWILPTNWRE